LDDFLEGRLFPEDTTDTYLHIRQPLLIVHGTFADRRLESYTELPDLEHRPETTIVPLATGALPHWERPSAVMDKISEFYADIDAVVSRNS
jgi:hypothetical protein